MRYSETMKDEPPIVELFKAAYCQMVPTGGRSGKQKEIVYDSGVPQSTISSIMAGRREGTEEQRRAIAAALGHEYESFLDIGRRALGLPVSRKESPPAPEVAGYLDKARAIIEAGGDPAVALKAMIKSLSP